MAVRAFPAPFPGRREADCRSCPFRLVSSDSAMYQYPLGFLVRPRSRSSIREILSNHRSLFGTQIREETSSRKQRDIHGSFPILHLHLISLIFSSRTSSLSIRLLASLQREISRHRDRTYSKCLGICVHESCFDRCSRCCSIILLSLDVFTSSSSDFISIIAARCLFDQKRYFLLVDIVFCHLPFRSLLQDAV